MCKLLDQSILLPSHPTVFLKYVKGLETVVAVMAMASMEVVERRNSRVLGLALGGRLCSCDSKIGREWKSYIKSALQVDQPFNAEQELTPT